MCIIYNKKFCKRKILSPIFINFNFVLKLEVQNIMVFMVYTKFLYLLTGSSILFDLLLHQRDQTQKASSQEPVVNGLPETPVSNSEVMSIYSAQQVVIIMAVCFLWNISWWPELQIKSSQQIPHQEDLWNLDLRFSWRRSMAINMILSTTIWYSFFNLTVKCSKHAE